MDDDKIRERAALHELRLDRWSFHTATDEHRLLRAFALLHDAYVARKLQRPDSRRLRITPQHLLAESRVFVASDRDEVVGTITVTGDSPAQLPLDKDYPDEIASLRGAGARVAEIGSLAVDDRHRHRQLAAALGGLSLAACVHLLLATDIVIGVNPNVEAYYRAVWGFTRIGPARHHAELDAPVIGMHVRVDALQRLPHLSALLEPWPCFDAPHRLSRRAFRRVFAERSDAFYTLDADTRRYLATQRPVLHDHEELTPLVAR